MSYQPIRAPRGTAISCKGWQQEAAMRMLMNNLDEEVAENPQTTCRVWRIRPGGPKLGRISCDRARASRLSKMTRLYWCSPENLLAYSALSSIRREC